MELHQVKYFLALGRHLNFTRAAQECNVSTPSLGRAIRLLEDELGGTLVNREGRTTHLTELGRSVTPLFQSAYAGLTSAQELAQKVRKGRYKRFVLAVEFTVGSGLILNSLHRLCALHPELEVSIVRCRESEALDALKLGRVEAVIGPSLIGRWDQLDSWLFGSDPMAVVVSSKHRLASKSSILLRELASERLIMRPYCSQMREIIEMGAADASAAARHEVCCDEDALQLVRSDFGITMLPASHKITWDIRRIPLVDIPSSRDVHLHAVQGRPRSAILDDYIRMVRAHEDKKQDGNERQPSGRRRRFPTSINGPSALSVVAS